MERQRIEAEEESKRSLDKEAIAAVEQTRKAVHAIASGKVEDSLLAIEQATGRTSILLVRNPANALIPLDSVIEVIDTAPHDIQLILEIAQDASRALDEKKYPTARTLLHSLMSEIRVRTYNLPLATYPDALQEAARLLNQKDTEKAKTTLMTALNTLVVIDRVTPLPLILAREAVNEAQKKGEDKSSARALLETAKHELERARELGYAGKDKEYADLDSKISKIEKQITDNEDVDTVLSKVKDKLSAFLKRQSAQRQGGLPCGAEGRSARSGLR